MAVRLRLERCWQHRLIEFGRLRPIFSESLDDLRLGADRLFAYLTNVMNGSGSLPAAYRPARESHG